MFRFLSYAIALNIQKEKPLKFINGFSFLDTALSRYAVSE